MAKIEVVYIPPKPHIWEVRIPISEYDIYESDNILKQDFEWDLSSIEGIRYFQRTEDQFGDGDELDIEVYDLEAVDRVKALAEKYRKHGN